MKKANKEIRRILFDEDIKFWELAECMGIHQVTLSNKLRTTLTDEDYKWVMKCIEMIMLRNQTNEEV